MKKFKDFIKNDIEAEKQLHASLLSSGDVKEIYKDTNYILWVVLNRNIVSKLGHDDVGVYPPSSKIFIFFYKGALKWLFVPSPLLTGKGDPANFVEMYDDKLSGINISFFFLNSPAYKALIKRPEYALYSLILTRYNYSVNDGKKVWAMIDNISKTALLKKFNTPEANTFSLFIHEVAGVKQ